MELFAIAQAARVECLIIPLQVLDTSIGFVQVCVASESGNEDLCIFKRKVLKRIVVYKFIEIVGNLSFMDILILRYFSAHLVCGIE